MKKPHLIDTTSLLPGDIILTYKKGNYFSELIWKVSVWSTNYKNIKPQDVVSHAMIYLGDGLIIESSFGGVQIHNINKYTTKTHVIHIKRVQKLFDYHTLYENVCAQEHVVGYGYLTLFWIVIKKLFKIRTKKDIENATVCIEFVVAAFRKVGVDLVPGRASFEVLPIELEKSPLLADITLCLK